LRKNLTKVDCPPTIAVLSCRLLPRATLKARNLYRVAIRPPIDAPRAELLFMKITSVETITVVVPVHDGAWHSAEFVPEGYRFGGQWIRLHWPEFPIVIIKLHTDEGLVGLGEVSKGIPEADVRAAAPFFEGQDLWSFNLQDLPLETMWFSNVSVYAAYEMALYDLMGKALGVPAYRLFGGKYRDLVPVSRCSGRMNPADAAELAKRCVDHGYSVLKMKATADDPVADRRFYQPARLFALVDQLRERGITNVQCFESPFDHSNLDWYALARQKLTTPIALHLNNAKEVREAIKREACDWINIGGPLSATYKQAALTEAAGIPTWHGSGVDMGIAEASYAHV
jgi:muconate cycloisomerase